MRASFADIIAVTDAQETSLRNLYQKPMYDVTKTCFIIIIIIMFNIRKLSNCSYCYNIALMSMSTNINIHC